MTEAIIAMSNQTAVLSGWMAATGQSYVLMRKAIAKMRKAVKVTETNKLGTSLRPILFACFSLLARLTGVFIFIAAFHAFLFEDMPRILAL
jgi:hypothetical protein